MIWMGIEGLASFLRSEDCAANELSEMSRVLSVAGRFGEAEFYRKKMSF
jgi:hypothetical protein